MNSGPIANIDGTNGFYMNNRAKNGSNQDCIRERGGRGLLVVNTVKVRLGGRDSGYQAPGIKPYLGCVHSLR